MCESWGLSISQAESCHLDKGFGDSHCLFRTITLIFMPSLRCPCHSLGSPVTPQETLWNGWEMTDGMSGVNWTKEKVQRGFKNHSCQLAKPSTHISSFYWARIQINILILIKPVGLMYAVVLPSGWLHITTLDAWASTETLMWWCEAVAHGQECVMVHWQWLVSHFHFWLSFVSW